MRILSDGQKKNADKNKRNYDEIIECLFYEFKCFIKHTQRDPIIFVWHLMGRYRAKSRFLPIDTNIIVSIHKNCIIFQSDNLFGFDNLCFTNLADGVRFHRQRVLSSFIRNISFENCV